EAQTAEMGTQDAARPAAGRAREGAILGHRHGCLGERSARPDRAGLAHRPPRAGAYCADGDLQPGDLIFTGTPAGVGPVRPGDRMEGEIEGVGRLSVAIGPAL
ncbi:fumarylacetoacetate hydrolase family protein, partial [Falsiroseomonas sp. HW251]|uniref:fumarylacetoacetate hydrolase family protein n=1 Tax=Falsiroseomonas sp. HW251 TaxID=3390998 RepID=UPI003D31F2FE